ncbi:MAG: peptide deformylase [Oscillospiraceae bacterium]|nr:peptide deformylase [Oscillospiraceae bacterium]MBQ7816184.1 peptide deformylase [Oscillospiraceae bacterium]
MVKELMHDPLFLAKKAETATKDDLQTAQDLLETLMAHEEECVGMAANMIGELKRIIAFDNDGEYVVMFNPEIIKKDGPYETEESCLSLLGGPRPTKRYKSIKVQYQNAQFQTRIKTFKGFAAQIIQHEVDHCDGILI